MKPRHLAAAVFLIARCFPLSHGADVVIYGATPGGIVTAVRAAREGLTVKLVSAYPHVGGIMSNGLGLFDTTYAGRRAPLYDEVHDRIMGHYGAGARGYEPHVAEDVFEGLLRGERAIEVLRGYYPVRADSAGRIVRRVTFRSFEGRPDLDLQAAAFVDASYEGDLAAVAGVSMTVGRESREQYGEAHAGVIFTKVVPLPKPNAYEVEGLNLREFRLTTTAPLPGSTGAADDAIQAFNFRVCLTDEPGNRMAVAKPQRYERDLYLKLLSKGRWGLSADLPDRKSSWNAPILIAGNFAYPDGSWETRRAIVARHRDFALGYLWFLQHDPAVSPKIHAVALQYGLARDEFRDNGGFPREVYVREARRMVGRYVFTEHDAEKAPGLERSPIHDDSIAFTEWPLDAHSCHWTTVEDSDFEGKVLLSEETRPGQIPYRALLPKEFDNLLVTGCVSSSHIGWGAIRLEPTWMHLGESAGYALVLAHGAHRPPGLVEVPRLQRLLVEHGVMISFFNDVRYGQGRFPDEDAAAQYWGARGFFTSYWARLDAPLSGEERARWEAIAGRALAKDPGRPITRGEAALWLYRADRSPALRSPK
jgi:hypothetical protein